MLSPSSKAISFSKQAFAFAALLLLLAGCMGSRMGGGRGRVVKGSKSFSTKGIEDWLVGPGQTQYFLKPVHLTGPKPRSIDMDITVRDTVAAVQFMDLRASLFGPDRYQTTDTLFYNDGAGWHGLTPIKLLFAEPGGSGMLTRIEVRIPNDKARAYLDNLSQGLQIGTQAGRFTFKPTKKARSRMQAFSVVAQPL